MAKYQKTTPEYWERWRENQERLLRIIEARLPLDEAARKAREQRNQQRPPR